MHELLKDIRRLLQDMTRGNGSSTAENYSMVDLFPIQNDEDLAEVEFLLSNDASFRKELVNVLFLASDSTRFLILSFAVFF